MSGLLEGMLGRTGTRRAVCALSALLLLPAPALAATYYVAEDGDDDAAGNASAPWQTLQHAAEEVTAGDTVIVRAGGYTGFYLEESGTQGAPITFRADGEVEIVEENPETPDGINLEGASYVVIEGFIVNGMERAGLRAVTAEHVTLRNNQADANGRWGILTGFVDDLVIEDNRTSGSLAEHGIYVGNSGDRPVIRNNVVWDNAANGIHMNGDAEQGGDGVISDALVEGNVIYGNGADGGSGINCDGVQDSLIVNNLIYDTHASGISLYQIDGGGPSTDNRVINNTVIVASDGRWALNIQDDSSGTTIYNNILLNLSSSRGAINLCGPACEADLTSDYNIVVNRFTRNDSDVISLANWRTGAGQDANSAVADAAALFSDVPGDDYHLSETSPAIDSGTSTNAPSRDLEGNQRPAGDAIDVGAYEACGNDCVPAGGVAGRASMGGTAGRSSNGGRGGAGNTGGNSAGGRASNGGSGGFTASGGRAGNPSASGGTGGRAGNGTGGSAGLPVSGGRDGEAGADGAAGSSGENSDKDSGCSCKLPSGASRSPWSALALTGALLVLALGRRRTSSRKRSRQ